MGYQFEMAFTHHCLNSQVVWVDLSEKMSMAYGKYLCDQGVIFLETTNYI